MKQLKTLCLVILASLALATTAKAQSFSYGIVAGMNMTKLKGGGLSSENRAGWYVGPKVAFNTVIGLGVDGSVQYSQRDLNVKGYGTETYRTIEVPLNVRYNIGLGKTLGVYLATGPQFGFALENMHWGQFDSNFGRGNMNTTWNVGAGIRLLGHLEVGLGYNFAIGKDKKIEAAEALNFKTNTVQVQLAYMF